MTDGDMPGLRGRACIWEMWGATTAYGGGLVKDMGTLVGGNMNRHLSRWGICIRQPGGRILTSTAEHGLGPVVGIREERRDQGRDEGAFLGL